MCGYGCQLPRGLVLQVSIDNLKCLNIGLLKWIYFTEYVAKKEPNTEPWWVLNRCHKKSLRKKQYIHIHNSTTEICCKCSSESSVTAVIEPCSAKVSGFGSPIKIVESKDSSSFFGKWRYIVQPGNFGTTNEIAPLYVIFIQVIILYRTDIWSHSVFWTFSGQLKTNATAQGKTSQASCGSQTVKISTPASKTTQLANKLPCDNAIKAKTPEVALHTTRNSTFKSNMVSLLLKPYGPCGTSLNSWLVLWDTAIALFTTPMWCHDPHQLYHRDFPRNPTIIERIPAQEHFIPFSTLRWSHISILTIKNSRTCY